MLPDPQPSSEPPPLLVLCFHGCHGDEPPSARSPPLRWGAPPPFPPTGSLPAVASFPVLLRLRNQGHWEVLSPDWFLGPKRLIAPPVPVRRSKSVPLVVGTAFPECDGAPDLNVLPSEPPPPIKGTRSQTWGGSISLTAPQRRCSPPSVGFSYI